MSDDLVLDPSQLKMSGPDVTLAKNVADVLHRKYPGHLWAVSVHGGVVQVFNLLLSGRFGFTVHADKIDTEYRAIVRAGGEILERYRQRRGAMNTDALQAQNRDFSGNLIYDR